MHYFLALCKSTDTNVKFLSMESMFPLDFFQPLADKKNVINYMCERIYSWKLCFVHLPFLTQSFAHLSIVAHP